MFKTRRNFLKNSALVAASTALSQSLIMEAFAADPLKIWTIGVAKVTKTMSASPRRISQIDVELGMKGNCDHRAQLILERVANTCPVFNSLHPELVKNIIFNWG